MNVRPLSPRIVTTLAGVVPIRFSSAVTRLHPTIRRLYAESFRYAHKITIIILYDDLYLF